MFVRDRVHVCDEEAGSVGGKFGSVTALMSHSVLLR